jgi:DNA-binding transcriptional ArsR family regulator
MEFKANADCLAGLGNPTRLKIFRLLVKAGHDGLPVRAIQNELGVPASTLSHHLRHLVSVGLVSQERSGVTLICRAKYDVMQDLIAFLTAECCVGVE